MPELEKNTCLKQELDSSGKSFAALFGLAQFILKSTKIGWVGMGPWNLAWLWAKHRFGLRWAETELDLGPSHLQAWFWILRSSQTIGAEIENNFLLFRIKNMFGHQKTIFYFLFLKICFNYFILFSLIFKYYFKK